jgi:predicted DNA-binding protein
MKRTANIVIRVSPAEKEKLEALAKKEGLTFSAWVRRFAYVKPDAALKATGSIPG